VTGQTENFRDLGSSELRNQNGFNGFAEKTKGKQSSNKLKDIPGTKWSFLKNEIFNAKCLPISKQI